MTRFLRRQSIDPLRAGVLMGGPGCPRALMRQFLHSDLARASRIDALSGYFVPSRRVRRLLRAAARRGRVRIVLSERSDVSVSRLASQWLYPSLLRAGVVLFEYQPQVLHAKVLVVDDIVYIGSANLDTRSLQLNFELLVRLPSVALAAALRSRIDLDCGYSQRVPADWPRQRTLLRRFLHGCAYFLVSRVDPYIARAKFRNLA